MSTPADNLGGNAAGEVALPSLGADDQWLISTGIDDPTDGTMAPLPTDAASSGADETPIPPVKEPDAVVTDPPQKAADNKAPAPADVKVDDKKVEATSLDPELSKEENDLVNALPEAQRPAATTRLKRSFFMDHYMNPDKPADEVRQHLAERSPSRYAELEASVFAKAYEKPEQTLAQVYEQHPETFTKLAMAVFNGDQKFFIEQIAGRKDLTPDQVKQAVDFYDRHKDSIADDAAPLSAVDEESIAEIEKYFPDKAPILRQALEAGKKAQAEAQTLKEKLEGKTQDDKQPVDPNNDPEVKLAREITELWDLGRDTVGDFFFQKASNPQSGIGIAATAAERKDAPLVALLKDFKATVFTDGLMVDGKYLIPDLHAGFTDWGKEREGFKDKLLHLDRFTQAREKQNVLDVAKGIFPYAETYYGERAKHPLFGQIDELISMVTSKLAIAPKVDTHIPGNLPSKGAAPGANGDDWLVADAVNRAGR